MSREEIIAITKRFLSEEFEVEQDSIQDNKILKDTLELDSLDYVDAMVVIEENFGFKTTARGLQIHFPLLKTLQFCRAQTRCYGLIPMSRWDGRSKGTATGYRIFIYLIDKFGVKAAYRLLWFVSYYYYLFAEIPKKISSDFIPKLWPLPLAEAKKLCRKNFYYLGQTLIDRNAFFTRKN
ncbi:MAG: hypothetical protein R2847_11195 [Bacteroidia bacterium]